MRQFARPDAVLLDALPDLKNLLATFIFIPTAERRLEADRSILKRLVKGSHCGGPYVSLALRLPEIQQECSTQRGLVSFAKVVESLTSKPLAMVKQLGLAMHPLMVEAFDNSWGVRKPSRPCH